MSEGNYQRFDALPVGWARYVATGDRNDPSGKHPMKWSGKDDPPAVGAKVKVRMNNIGPGVVRGYFVEYGWLGVLVKPSKPPKWWREQTKDMADPLAHIFGAEF